MYFQVRERKDTKDFIPFVSHKFMALERNFPAYRSAYIAWNVKMWLFSFSYIIFDNKDCTVT